MDDTRKLAAFCKALSIDRLPTEVIEKTKLCVLDYVANIYGSLELDAVTRVVSFIKSLGGPQTSTALGCGFKTGIYHAAFINGTTGEAVEAQDGLRFGGNHPGTSVIPAAFVMAEALGKSGRALLEAIVAGYEAANRPAAAMHPFHTLSGFLPTGTCGTFGAAVAAGKLQGLDGERLLNALGIAGYLTPLSMAEHLMGGCTIKIVQGGQAAGAGIMAAGLAESGITGHDQVLEGSSLKGGFLKITTGTQPDSNKLLEGLGDHFTVMDVYFKPFTACRHTHGAAQATLELMKTNPVRPGDVERIEVFTYGIALLAVGKGVSERDSFVSAQFSIPYVVAACILDGKLGPGQLTQARISDPGILALSHRVKVTADEELNKIYPMKTSSRVEIVMRDGRRLVKQVDIPKGDPRDPMGEADIIAKLKAFAGSRPSGVVDKVIEEILHLEERKDIGTLTKLI